MRIISENGRLHLLRTGFRRLGYPPVWRQNAPALAMPLLYGHGLPAEAALLLDELNQRVKDADAAIGPSYLMDERIYKRADGLDRVWKHSIMPLLDDLLYVLAGGRSRLLFLAGYAKYGPAWLAEAVPVDQAAALVPAVADALWRQAARAIHRGLLPGYVVEESSTGASRAAEQLHRHHGLLLPLEVRHDEFTVDIAENQVLRRLRTVAQGAGSRRRIQADAQAVAARVHRRHTPGTADPIPAWSATRLNARYHSALRAGRVGTGRRRRSSARRAMSR